MNNTAEVLEGTISGYDHCLGEKYWAKWQEIVTKYGMSYRSCPTWFTFWPLPILWNAQRNSMRIDEVIWSYGYPSVMKTKETNQQKTSLHLCFLTINAERWKWRPTSNQLNADLSQQTGQRGGTGCCVQVLTNDLELMRICQTVSWFKPLEVSLGEYGQQGTNWVLTSAALLVAASRLKQLSHAEFQVPTEFVSAGKMILLSRKGRFKYGHKKRGMDSEKKTKTIVGLCVMSCIHGDEHQSALKIKITQQIRSDEGRHHQLIPE